MDSLNIAEIDETFADSYTTEYSIENKQIHLQKWFNYYCPTSETDAESDFQADADSLKQVLNEDGTGTILA